MKLSFSSLAICCLAPSLCLADLQQDFLSPPDTTKPRCYWYWMDGNVTKEGITKDLEAMKRVGIGEAYIGVISGQAGIEAGSLKVLSEPFWEVMAHTMAEGTRLGVDIGVFNSPGWSQSGGPWVKPDQAMRYVDLPEVRVQGPQHYNAKLPAPTGEFKDISVLAFPAPTGDADTLGNHAPKITATPNVARVETLFDRNLERGCDLPKGMIEVALPEAFTARSLTIHPAKALNVTCDLEASDDGVQFRTIRTFPVDRHKLTVNVGPVPLAPVTVAIPATKSRFFRFRFSGACALHEIELSASPRLESYAEKQMIKVFQSPQPPADFYQWPPQPEPEAPGLVVDPAQVKNLSAQLKADGTLDWQVPAGEWIIVRAVARPTGTTNGPAAPEATGLEIDKMSRPALQSHFAAYVGELLRRVPAAARTSWKHVVADSYETGPQNWTDDFLADFQRRYRYEARAFFPALTGRVVGSAARSDRFLWDVRRMVADRVAGDYVGGLRELCHQHGLKMWLENYGHWGFPGEFLQYGGQADELSGEFWATGTLGSVELRDAASAAHVYGKPQVFAEAFTGGPLFTSTPFSLKARGDWAYAQGINQFVLHLYIHQPKDDQVPGISAPFGTEFNRHNTWFETSKAWYDYQRRSTVLLQHGQHVADIAYFIGEDTPKMTGEMNPALPDGFNFDFVNAEAILTRMQVSEGRLVLPDGMSYTVLVLPKSTTMRPEVLRKIRDLIAAGATVLGAPPTQSPSLRGYPQCDAEIRSLAEEIWSHCDGQATTSATVGKGRIFRGLSLSEVVAQLKLPPDLAGVDARTILSTHRKGPEADIYFLSNQSSQPVEIRPTFRVAGLAPELWHPDTGLIESPGAYAAADGSITVPLHLDAVGSVFVVFRTKLTGDPVVKVLRDKAVVLDTAALGSNAAAAPAADSAVLSVSRLPGGELAALGHQAGRYTAVLASGSEQSFTIPTLAAPIAVNGPWAVHFPAPTGLQAPVTMAALIPLNAHSDPKVKYFSGTAVYQTDFEVPADWIKKDDARMLDLGNVEAMAEVVLNGRSLGMVWKAPFQIPVEAGALKAGANTLEIRVTNAWHNRLVGQAKQGAALNGPGIFQPVVLGRGMPKANAPLFAAGLIGPVRLVAEPVVKIEMTK